MIGDGMFARTIQKDGNGVPRQIINVWSGYTNKLEACLAIDADMKTNEQLRELIGEIIIGMKAFLGDQGYKKPLRKISDTEFLSEVSKSSVSEYKKFFERYLFGGFS